MSILIILILLALGAIVGGTIGYFARFFISLGQKGSMELQVRKMMLDAEERAKKVVEEAEARGREKVDQLTAEYKERERDLKNTEDRLVRKEEMLDSRQLKIDTEEATLSKKTEEVVVTKAKADELVHAQQEKLEKVANLSADEAKTQLIQTIEKQNESDHREPHAQARSSRATRALEAARQRYPDD
jgi:ribonucrease Y